MLSGVELGATEAWMPVLDIQDQKPATSDQSSQTDRFYIPVSPDTGEEEGGNGETAESPGGREG